MANTTKKTIGKMAILGLIGVAGGVTAFASPSGARAAPDNSPEAGGDAQPFYGSWDYSGADGSGLFDVPLSGTSTYGKAMTGTELSAKSPRTGSFGSCTFTVTEGGKDVQKSGEVVSYTIVSADVFQEPIGRAIRPDTIAKYKGKACVTGFPLSYDDAKIAAASLGTGSGTAMKLTDSVYVMPLSETAVSMTENQKTIERNAIGAAFKVGSSTVWHTPSGHDVTKGLALYRDSVKGDR